MKKIIYVAFALLLTLSAQAQIDRTVQPKPGPAPTINLGKPHRFELPNGLKVLVVENHKLPRVTFSLSLDNPPSLEGGIKGVDDLASSMMGNGTSKISKDDYNGKIDYYGASVYFSVGGVGGSTLSRYFPEILSLVAKGALDPLFTQDELDSERAKLLDGLKADEKSVPSIARQARRTLIFGKNHPSGEYLTEGTINKVTLADVKAYYQKYFVPENAYLVIVGDVKFDEVKKLVTRDFSSWKKASAPVSVYTEPENLAETEIDFIDVPSAVQSEISVNNVVNLKMTDPDYFAALLANYILGGGGDGRLFLNLREAHGWTYGAYSNLSGDKRTTVFSASASVRNSVTDSAVVELKKELARIRATQPTQAELDLAKAAYTGSFVMNAEKPQTIANFALREETQALPADFFENYIKNIDAVTLEQVQAAARKYILNEGTRIVVVGKASEILPGLEKTGIPINYFDRFANPTTKPEPKAIDSAVTVNSILNNYINAIGGKENLENVKTVAYTAAAEIQGQKLTFEKKATTEGKLLQEINSMGMSLFKSVVDGDTGYIEVQGQRQDMTSDDLSDLKYRGIFPELQMLNATTIQLDGIENINGRDAYKLVDDATFYFYDVESGLKVAEGVKKEIIPGQEIDQRGTYDDYREVGDVKVPYKLSMNVGVDVILNVTEVKINEGVSDSDFR